MSEICRRVDYLILSSTLDFSSDFISIEMQSRGLSYFRLNRDQFENYNIEYNVDLCRLIVEGTDIGKIVLDDSLKSVYFRCPVFIRSNKAYSLDRQLYRSQWSSFVRNLSVFDKARWMNHPMYIFQAENKVYQLEMAKRVGLKIPNTLVANSVSLAGSNNSTDFVRKEKRYIVKALDTPLFYENGQEMFTYSTVVTGEEILSSNLSMAPVFIQECIKDKVDIRVTIIGNVIYSAKITSHGNGIDGDWRRTKKEALEYTSVELPDDIKKKLLSLMACLNLSFGGIDMTLSNGQYTFIEVNPTGEWGWLVNSTGANIHKKIVDWLIQ